MYGNSQLHHHHRYLAFSTRRPDPALCHHSARKMWRTIVKRASRSPVVAQIIRCAGGDGGDSLLVSPRHVSDLQAFGRSGSSCGKVGCLCHGNLGNPGFRVVRLGQNGEVSSSFAVFPCCSDAKVSCFSTRCRSLSTVAEVVSSSTDVDEEAASSSSSTGEIQDLLEQLVEEDAEGRRKESDSLGESKNRTSWRRHPCRQQRHQQKIHGGMNPYKYALLKRRQIKMETEAWEHAAKEYQELLTDMCQQKLSPNLPYMKSLFMGWFEPLRDKIAEEQNICREAGKKKIPHAPYFVQLPADMMAVITMHKLMGLLMTSDGSGSARLVMAALCIGDAVEQEIRIQRFLEKTGKKGGKQEGQGTNNGKDQENLRKKVKELMKKQKLHTVRKIVKAHDDTLPWGQQFQAKVGSRLIDLLIQTAYIQPPVNQSGNDLNDIRPAFRHTQKVVTRNNSKTNRCYGVIECDPLVRQGLDKSARHMVIPYTPMLVPPMDWTGYDKGAHFFLPSYIMRTHGVKQQQDAVKTAPREQMQAVYEALNTLGNTKWRINKRVLGVVDRLWSSGGRLAGLVDRENIPLPEKPDTEDDNEIRKWKWQLQSDKKVNNERHSQRCDVELKLSVARNMMDEDGFYYPHNIDFRGRAYPMHPYLNHLGSDLCRGVLEFAEGRPLGKSGLRWLKIHLANLYAWGVDKLSYDGRIAFAESNVENIFDSADKPLEGRQWWLGAEDPFQCLAVCINLTEALRSSSPESTISHLPVHQDGSCNGLQHYAALGRDQLGAAAVNLVDGDKPADVYSEIAARVLKIMREDSEKNPADISNARYAKLLLDQVDRKLVKQTVMTSVYGVTYIGARDQIKRRLKERHLSTNIDEVDIFGASCYAAKVTLTALGEVFQGARGIMNWLGDCARVVAANNDAVRWTTPIGLPVVQPYKELGRHLVKTSLQILTLQRETDKVMVKRQRTAFPPNFVHSLDGSHMMMTAVECRKAGLSFAGVHDSFWTHACDVDIMNRILREKFVELYQQPILENLLNGFEKSFPSLHFPPLPDRGDFDVRNVIHSTYFFN